MVEPLSQGVRPRDIIVVTRQQELNESIPVMEPSACSDYIDSKNRESAGRAQGRETEGSQAARGPRRGWSGADSGVRDDGQLEEAPGRRFAELRPDFLLHSGQCRSQACRGARGQGARADRFQV